jgi:tRNA pseudouridine38-40 synthase
VQQTLEDVWKKQTSETIRLTGGSRTDAGVSARGHVSSFRSETSIPEQNIPLFWNAKLPDSIAIRKAIRVEDDFNPRYDALGKEYRYRIMNSSVRPVLFRHLVSHIPGTLDMSAMRQALPFFCRDTFFSFADGSRITDKTARAHDSTP